MAPALGTSFGRRIRGSYVRQLGRRYEGQEQHQLQLQQITEDGGIGPIAPSSLPISLQKKGKQQHWPQL